LTERIEHVADRRIGVGQQDASDGLELVETGLNKLKIPVWGKTKCGTVINMSIEKIEKM